MRYLAVAIVFALTPSAFAELVSNGSFESSSPPINLSVLNAVDSSTIPNWTVTSGNLDYIGGYWAAEDGAVSLDLNGSTTGQIQQTLSTVANQNYTLHFWATSNPDFGTGTSRTMQWDAFNSTTLGTDGTGTVTTTTSSTQTHTSMEWAYYTFTFTATSTSTILSFTGDSITGGPVGVALDNVSVVETPEPGAFLLFGAGLGGLAFWRRSQSKKSRAAKA